MASLNARASLAACDSVAAFSAAHFASHDASHDASHTKRVAQLAAALLAAERASGAAAAAAADADLELVVRLAALLHDVDDAKYGGADGGDAPVARAALAAAGAPAALAERIVRVIATVSYSAEARRLRDVSAPLPELDAAAALVQDADRLEAIGAMASRAPSPSAARAGGPSTTVRPTAARLRARGRQWATFTRSC